VSGIPEKPLRVRENNRRQYGKRSPFKDKVHQSVKDYLLNQGAIKVYGPNCSSDHKKQPHITLRLKEL